MPVPITALYTAILAIILTVLSARAGLMRGKVGAAIGDGGNQELALNMRRHGNAIEYVPIALLLMLMLELNGISAYVLHGLGAVLVLARIAHPIGIHDLKSPMRFLGAGGTALMIVVAAGLVLWQLLAG